MRSNSAGASLVLEAKTVSIKTVPTMVVVHQTLSKAIEAVEDTESRSVIVCVAQRRVNVGLSSLCVFRRLSCSGNLVQFQFVSCKEINLPNGSALFVGVFR